MTDMSGEQYVLKKRTRKTNAAKPETDEITRNNNNESDSSAERPTAVLRPRRKPQPEPAPQPEVVAAPEAEESDMHPLLQHSQNAPTPEQQKEALRREVADLLQTEKKKKIEQKKAEKIELEKAKAEAKADKKAAREAARAEAEERRIAEQAEAEKRRIAERAEAEKRRAAEQAEAEKRRAEEARRTAAEKKAAEEQRIARQKAAEEKRRAAAFKTRSQTDRRAAAAPQKAPVQKEASQPQKAQPQIAQPKASEKDTSGLEFWKSAGEKGEKTPRYEKTIPHSRDHEPDYSEPKKLAVTGDRKTSTAASGHKTSTTAGDRRTASYERQPAPAANERRPAAASRKGEYAIGKKIRTAPWESHPTLFLIGVVMLLMALIIGVFFLRKTNENQELLAKEETFYDGITVENIPLGGLIMEEAKTKVNEAISKRYTWDIKVDCGGETYTIPDILEHDVDGVLAQAFSIGHEGDASKRISDISLLERKGMSYTIPDHYTEEAVAKAVKAVADQYDVAAVDAELIGYDEESGFVYSDEKSGRTVDETDLQQQLTQLLEQGTYQGIITGTVSEVAAEMNLEQAKETYTCLAKFSTEANVNNEDRDHNVALACETINGTVLQPGEEFSMNALIGETTEAQGYREAATYAAGQVVAEFGGGVCQVSSTIYNAVVKSGLKTTERNNHSMSVSYVPLGEDAMLSYSYSDLKFLNNSKGSILVLVESYKAEVTCRIYGIPILEEGVTVKMDSRIEEEIPIPDPKYIEDDTLPPGTEEYKTRGKVGYRVVTDLVTYKDGEEISREFLHNSTYRPQTPVIRRNSGS